MRTNRVAAGALWGAAGLLVFAATPGLAQTASQITPPSFRPPVEGGVGTLSIPDGPGLDAPPGAERLTVRVGRVAVEGVPPALAGQTAQVVAGLEGQTVSAAALFAAARALEQAYARAGYALARVVLPAQDLRDGGTLRLVVINGRLGKLDTTQLPPAIRGRIEAVLAPLLNQPGITLPEIERRLLLAGDTPGTVLRSTLAAGSDPGTSTLVVDARYRLLTGFVSLDNTLSDALGRYTTGIGLDANSPTGHGELFYLRASGYVGPSSGDSVLADRPRNRALAGGVIVPLGTNGLTLNLEATDARATPTPQAGAVNFTSDFQRYSARLRYPVLRSRAASVYGELAFDAQDETLSAVSPVEAPLSLDRLRILRAAVDGSAVLPWERLGLPVPEGTISARLLGSAGLDILDARGPGDATAALPLSRLGSRPDFKKLELSVDYTQPVLPHLVAAVQGRGLWAFGQALPRSEQIGLATPSGLSSFAAGLFQGDSGFVVRGELQAPFAFPVPGNLFAGTLGVSPYAFGAFGQVHLNQPSALERRTVRGASYGLGARLGAAPDASFSAFSISFEWGRQARSDRPNTGDRFTVTTLLRF